MLKECLRFFRLALPTLVAIVLAVALRPWPGMAQVAVNGGGKTSSASVSDCLVENTRVRNLDLSSIILPIPDIGANTKLTWLLSLDEPTRAQQGQGRRRGRVRTQVNCIDDQGINRPFMTKTSRLNPNGGAWFATEVPANTCAAVILDTFGLRGNQPVPAGNIATQRAAAEAVGPGVGANYFRDPSTLLLDDDRFRVDVDWQDFGSRGAGRGFATSDNSLSFFFFDRDNAELLLKVIDGCSLNDHFWVFAAATTNVEFSVTVTDTLTNQSRVYDNPLGQPAPAIVDTQAFATCP